MKVLFLDVDGVLNRCALSNQGLETDKCDLLADLCRTTGCKVVVSSMWRKYPLCMERLLAMFASRGIAFAGQTPVLTSVTPNSLIILSSVPRREEIQAWLKDHPEVTHYAIVDDDTDADNGAGRYVRTRSNDGLQPKHVEAITELLSLRVPAGSLPASPGALPR